MNSLTSQDAPGDISRTESDLYKRLSRDMRQGLKRIYKEIYVASVQEANVQQTETDQLFHEASAQLSEVLATTESATVSIMDIVERHLDMQMEAADIIAAARAGTATPDKFERLAEINTSLGDDLTNIMTTLSFQDLTGQRIKKVVGALHKIENTVVELYVSSGLILKGRENDPQKDIKVLEEEAQQAVKDFRECRGKSELKGPGGGISQNAIDDLMAQLGMD